MNNGKTNQLNRLEYGMSARHRRVQRCPMGHLAFYLFYRWNILREQPPQFNKREQWYGIHLLRGVDRQKPLAYHTQRDWIRRLSARPVCHLRPRPRTWGGVRGLESGTRWRERSADPSRRPLEQRRP